jgi:hypothetical protein
MGTIDLAKSPPAHAAAHAAVSYSQKPAEGLRNMPAHEDLQQAVTRILEEETGNVLHQLRGKLPPEAVERLDSKGGLKEKLYSSINRHYQEMFSRYATFDDQDEAAVFTRHTSVEIAELLRSMGGAVKFNIGEIEKIAENRRGLSDLEAHTNNILRRKADAGAFSGGDAAGSVVKCVFRDNPLKPKTVTDVKLTVNISDAELINPVFHYHAAAKYLIKELISRHIIESIERGINGSQDEKSGELITELLSETVPAGFNPANVRETVRKSADIEAIRTRGFNVAVNALVSILENAKLNYQFIENTRNGRELAIREYEDNNTVNLPDERYAIRLWYFDREQLVDERNAYDAQIRNFELEVQHLWNLIEVIYQDSKSVFQVNDFEDLAKKNKSRIRDLIKRKAGEPLHEAAVEVSGEKGNVRARLARMHERIKNMYEFLYPIERRVMEDRLDRLEEECSRIDFLTNPHHLQSGLLIDVEITSIKRKKTTLDSLADALEEFLHRVHEGFQDTALATFGSQAPAVVPEKPARKPRGS